MAQSSTATCGQVTSKVQRGPPSAAAHPSWCLVHRAVTVLPGGTFPPVPGSHIPKKAPVCPPLSGEGFSPCPRAHGCQLSIQPSPVPVRPQELRVKSPSPLPGNRGNPEVKVEAFCLPAVGGKGFRVCLPAGAGETGTACVGPGRRASLLSASLPRECRTAHSGAPSPPGFGSGASPRYGVYLCASAATRSHSLGDLRGRRLLLTVPAAGSPP